MRPTARSIKPVPPPACVRCRGRTLRGNISLGQRFLCRGCDCLMIGGLEPPLGAYTFCLLCKALIRSIALQVAILRQFEFSVLPLTRLRTMRLIVQDCDIHHQITEQKLGYTSHQLASRRSPSRPTPGSVPIPSTYPNNDGARGGSIWQYSNISENRDFQFRKSSRRVATASSGAGVSQYLTCGPTRPALDEPPGVVRVSFRNSRDS